MFRRFCAFRVFKKLRRLRQPRSSRAERLFCESGYFLFRQVARGWATSVKVFRFVGLVCNVRCAHAHGLTPVARLSVTSFAALRGLKPTARNIEPLRGSSGRLFFFSVTAFHFFANVLRVSASPREILLALTHTVLVRLTANAGGDACGRRGRRPSEAQSAPQKYKARS